MHLTRNDRRSIGSAIQPARVPPSHPTSRSQPKEKAILPSIRPSETLAAIEELAAAATWKKCPFYKAFQGPKR